MSEGRITSFEEFWPFYVREHSLPSTRIMHFVGTAVALQIWWLLLAVPVAGYGMAWISHFGIEKNKPASFKYPLWSFIADMKLWAMMLTGRMGAEVERILGAKAK